MSKISEELVEASLQAALSAIEIYNKPDFKYREQTFTILMTNAWELLLKAKILQDNKDALESIYIPLGDDTFKTNRSGNPLTLEIIGCARRCPISANIMNNLEQLIEIRDTAVHYYHDETIAYIVFILGVAALQNYQKLMKDWFDKSLLQYNFFIMPLAFAYNFQTLSSVDISGKPEVVANIIASVLSDQRREGEDEEHPFVCEVKTAIVSAKKVSEDTDFTTKIDPNSEDTTIVERLQRITDLYPLSYTELINKVKKAKPRTRQGDIDKIIRNHALKSNRYY